MLTAVEFGCLVKILNEKLDTLDSNSSEYATVSKIKRLAYAMPIIEIPTAITAHRFEADVIENDENELSGAYAAGDRYGC